ncbi:MAG: cytochrome c family protein [Sphingomonadaceae bacterium]|nr:cytochrome c family protein [Sphingomonadaceae bacterium]
MYKLAFATLAAAAATTAALAVPPLPPGTPAYASLHGDPVKGKADFAVCKTCHSALAGQNRIGPSLHGVVGRKAGTVPGYTYSAANKNSGITWTEPVIYQYLIKPQAYVPGTKMTYAGQPDAQKRADIIAYLKTSPTS